MPKILITGCAGFIGSHATQALLKQGYEVVGLDNLNDYYNPAWKQANLDQFSNQAQFKFIKADITDLAALKQIFQDHRFDKILHLAARAGVRPSIEQPLLYQKVNVEGTLNLLEMAREHQIPHFISASSSSVYGNQPKVPFSETDPVNEPISPYAATKKAGEMLCYTYSHLYGIKTSCLRFFTVYGPAGRPDMAPYLFTEAILQGKPINKFGDGSTKRDYTYIDDIVDGIMAVVAKPFKFEIFNLGNNTPVSLNEFIALLEEIIGKKALINQLSMQPGDVNTTYADISKAQQLLGYEPRTSFKDGLTKFVKWYKTHRL